MAKTPLNGALKWIVVGLAVASACVAIVSGYNEMGARAEANAEHVEELKAEQFLQWIDIDANNERAIKVEVQMTNIAEDVSKILEKVEKLHE